MKIYVAIPYSFNPTRSFEIANKIAAELMAKGNVVFSPVSHSHPIADYLPAELRTDSLWWMAQDLPLVDWCDKMIVVCIGENGHQLIEQSKGVTHEWAHAVKMQKPIEIFEYYD